MRNRANVLQKHPGEVEKTRRFLYIEKTVKKSKSDQSRKILSQWGGGNTSNTQKDLPGNSPEEKTFRNLVLFSNRRLPKKDHLRKVSQKKKSQREGKKGDGRTKETRLVMGVKQKGGKKGRKGVLG